MGRFLNKGNLDFAKARRSDYVDKSAMIQVINETLDTENHCTCVSRGRRFGKSMAAHMLYAYYDKFCDSRHLFEDLAIAKMPSFEENLNRYPVIYLDVTSFTTKYKDNKDIVNIMQRTIKEEVCELYSDVQIKDSYDLMDALFAVVDKTKERFFFIIDEWDAICREFEKEPDVMDDYVNLLRRMFKSGETTQVFVGVYMTGILPIKKYNTESALNNFREYSMVIPRKLATSFGFTHDEVEALCRKHGMDLGEMERWYDGYHIGPQSKMFNPYSVMNAIDAEAYGSYWQATGSYEKVSNYIQMNFDGLKDDVLEMLGGGSVGVDTTSFSNDMNVVKSKDDVLTVLIHLGYLTYDPSTKSCRIPNMEVAEAFSNAVKDTSWSEIVEIIKNSRALLEATWAQDEKAVAHEIERAHNLNTSILRYNNENSLACVLSIAYIWARNEYSIQREFATGKGFADLVMIPRRNSDKPAMIIELKWNKSENTAIDQIRERNYPEKLRDYEGNLLLVGISYNRKSKKHTCRIEKC